MKAVMLLMSCVFCVLLACAAESQAQNATQAGEEQPEAFDSDFFTVWRLKYPEKPPNLQNKFGLGANVSYIGHASDKDVHPKTYVMPNVTMTYFAHELVSFEFVIGYTEGRVDLDMGGGDIDVGDFYQLPMLLSLRWHGSVNSRTSAYILGGAGYFINNYDADKDVVEALAGDTITIDETNSPGFHVGLGFEYFVSPNATLNFGFKYIWTSPEADISWQGCADEPFDINPLLVGFGYRYYF